MLGKKSLIMLICVILAALPAVAETQQNRGKTYKIGDHQWYTEQNSFEDMLAVAKKENKPLLTVFSATWCGPCQIMKKNTLSTPAFKAIADNVVLLYIEQTQEKGGEYVKKHGISAFPTVKLLSADAYELGAFEGVKDLDGFKTLLKEGNAHTAKDGKGNKDVTLDQKIKRCILLGDAKNAVADFKTFVAEKGDEAVVRDHLELVSGVISLNLKSGAPADTDTWLQMVRKYKKHALTFQKIRDYYKIHAAVINHRAENNDKKGAEAVYLFLIDDCKDNKEMFMVADSVVALADKHDLQVDKTLEILESMDKNAVNALVRLNVVFMKAQLLTNKKGKKEDARNMLHALTDDKIYNNFFALTQITQKILELGLGDEKTLAVAQKTVTIYKSPDTLNVLGEAYAALKKYKEAVATAKEAMTLTGDENMVKGFKSDIEKWEKELKDTEK